MSLKPGEDIPKETHHDIEQFFDIVKGKVDICLWIKTKSGESRKKTFHVEAGQTFVIPANTPHQVINTGSKPTKLYTIYSQKVH
jgi:mannose-6-phosphate isomerase-like protein (cupin superfamily)